MGTVVVKAIRKEDLIPVKISEKPLVRQWTCGSERTLALTESVGSGVRIVAHHPSGAARLASDGWKSEKRKKHYSVKRNPKGAAVVTQPENPRYEIVDKLRKNKVAYECMHGMTAFEKKEEEDNFLRISRDWG